MLSGIGAQTWEEFNGYEYYFGAYGNNATYGTQQGTTASRTSENLSPF